MEYYMKRARPTERQLQKRRSTRTMDVFLPRVGKTYSEDSMDVFLPRVGKTYSEDSS
jgi:hypothetical protein